MRKIIDTRGEYRNAYNLYLITQGECPHWDYENPDGVGAACCIEMENTKQRCRRIKAKLSH